MRFLSKNKLLMVFIFIFSVLALTTQANAEMTWLEKSTFKAIFKHPIRSINPSYISAFGFSQLLSREGQNMRSHWSDIRRAIENVDNMTPDTGSQNNSPLSFLSNKEKKAITNDIENIEYLSNLLNNETLSEKQRLEAINTGKTIIDRLNNRFIAHGKEPLFLIKSAERTPIMEAGTFDESLSNTNGNILGTSSVKNACNTGHNVQCWEINKSERKQGRWRLSIQHAKAGKQGGFHLIAWEDSNGDGIPNRKIGQSGFMTASKDNEWSSWEFNTGNKSFFVGNSWPQQNEIVFYQMGGTPSGYKGLGSVNFYSRKFSKPPTSKAKPRFTNIRLEYLGN